NEPMGRIAPARASVGGWVLNVPDEAGEISGGATNELSFPLASPHLTKIESACEHAWFSRARFPEDPNRNFHEPFPLRGSALSEYPPLSHGAVSTRRPMSPSEVGPADRTVRPAASTRNRCMQKMPVVRRASRWSRPPVAGDLRPNRPRGRGSRDLASGP